MHRWARHANYDARANTGYAWRFGAVGASADATLADKRGSGFLERLTLMLGIMWWALPVSP